MEFDLRFSDMANFKAVMRLFNKFGQSANESVMDSLYNWMFSQLSINGITLAPRSKFLSDSQHGLPAI